MIEQEHTKEFEEVMRRPPNFITRNGHWLLLALLGILALLIWQYGPLLF
jgi:hypothetical protein